MLFSRRQVIAAAAASSIAPNAVIAATPARLRPFQIAVPESKLSWIRDRVANARLPREMPRDALDNGMDANWLASLREYWLERYDWRTQEAALNAYPCR